MKILIDKKIKLCIHCCNNERSCVNKIYNRTKLIINNNIFFKSKKDDNSVPIGDLIDNIEY